MKKTAKEPRLLPNVMEAIANLKERNGSTQKQIVDQITRSLKHHGNRSINVQMQVRRALEHGLHSGLIKQKSGKFRLGLDKRNYEIFKKRTRIHHPTYESKRGRRSKRRRPRRSRRRSKNRRRRYSTDEEDETEGNSDTDRSFTKSPEPQDKSRKRRKSRRKGRKSRRRYRRRGADSDHEVDSDRSSPTNQRKSGPAEEKRSDQDKLNYQSKGGSQMQQDQNQPEHPQEEDGDCGNPDCLCNIKQEDGSRNSIRDNYFHQSYLN